jgi:hypothetical protein
MVSARLQARLLPAVALTMMVALATLPVSAAITKCQSPESVENQPVGDRAAADGRCQQSPDGKVVQIESGQYLISIDGLAKEQSFVTTPFLVVRSNSARLLVQVSERLCQVSVLSGSAVIKNTIERHIVQLHKGVVYACELRGGVSHAASFENVAEPSSWMPLFQTVRCRTMLATIAPAALNSGPFVHLLDTHDLTEPSNKTLAGTEIVSPPTMLNYEIGEQVAKLMPLSPVLRQHFSPSGIVPATTSQLVADNAAR